MLRLSRVFRQHDPVNKLRQQILKEKKSKLTAREVYARAETQEQRNHGFQNLSAAEQKEVLKAHYNKRYGPFFGTISRWIRPFLDPFILGCLLIFGMPIGYNVWFRRKERLAMEHEAAKKALKILVDSEVVKKVLGDKINVYTTFSGYDVKLAYTMFPGPLKSFAPPYHFVDTKNFKSCTFGISTNKQGYVYCTMAARRNVETGEWVVENVVLTFLQGKLKGKRFSVYDLEDEKNQKEKEESEATQVEIGK